MLQGGAPGGIVCTTAQTSRCHILCPENRARHIVSESVFTRTIWDILCPASAHLLASTASIHRLLSPLHLFRYVGRNSEIVCVLLRLPGTSDFLLRSTISLSLGRRGCMVYILTVFLLMYGCVFFISTCIFVTFVTSNMGMYFALTGIYTIVCGYRMETLRYQRC